MTVPKDELYKLYIVQEKPMHIVADEMGIAVGTVYNYLKKYEITTREPHKGMKGKKLSDDARAKISTKTRGKKLSPETIARISESRKLKGKGHKKYRADGYVAVYYPNHPKSNKSGYIMEHILVMEKIIGRHLMPDECVHHKNFIRNDNRIENLELMKKREHISYHSTLRWEQKRRRNDLSIKQF